MTSAAITRKGPGDFEPVNDSRDDAVSDFIEQNARRMAEEFVLEGTEVPGLAYMDRGEHLTIGTAYLSPTVVPREFWARDVNNKVLSGPDGSVRVDLEDLIRALADCAIQQHTIVPERLRQQWAERQSLVANLMRKVAILNTERYIRDHAEEVYDAWAESMEQGYE